MADHATTQVEPDAAPSTHLPQTGGAIALFVIAGFQLMLVVDGTIMNVALPAIQHSLGFSVTGLSWVTNSYALAVGGLLLLGGRAGDILGRRRVFIAGVAVFTLSSLIAGLATSTAWLITARAVQGAGAAFAGPSTLSLIATNFVDKADRNRALGVFSAAAGGGGSLGMIAGGVLTEWASWRWVLFVNVPIGVAILALAPRHIRESVRHPGRFDLSGALTSSIGVTALAYALIRGASDGWGESWTLVCFAAAAVLLAGFLLIERRASQPILPLSVTSQRTRAGAYLNMFLLAAAMIGVFYFLTLFLQDSRGFTPLKTGLAFLAMTIPLFIAARLAPKLLAKLGAKSVTTIGTVLITASMAWLAQLDNTSTFTNGVLGPLLLVGAGVGLTFMPLNSLILSSVVHQDAGAASGLLQALQRVGGAVGLALLVAVAASADAHAEQAARAYQLTTLFSVVALAVAVLVIKSSPRNSID
jgi:EmrB/QacA subfamily drug resistance transporter